MYATGEGLAGLAGRIGVRRNAHGNPWLDRFRILPLAVQFMAAAALQELRADLRAPPFEPTAGAWSRPTMSDSDTIGDHRGMAITSDDRLAIYELIALHGHLMDGGEFDRLTELFTDDFVYDLEHLGYGQLEGAKAFVDSATALGDDNPLGHHVTNSLVIAEEDDGSVHVRSKGIGIRADGSSGSVVYEDLVRRNATGWRIARRTVIPRRRALQA